MREGINACTESTVEANKMKISLTGLSPEEKLIILLVEEDVGWSLQKKAEGQR